MTIKFDGIGPKGDEFEKAAWEATKKGLLAHWKKQLRGIKCAEHNVTPKVIVKGSLKNPDFRIEGCCPALIKEATKALQ